MTDDELKAIKERADKATPGPWFRYGVLLECHRPAEDGTGSKYHSLCVRDPEGRPLSADVSFENGDFIAAARTDVPALVEECLKRGERIRELEQQLKLKRNDTAYGEED